MTGKYDVIIYIPSSAEWGSFLSLGESCLSAVSLTEIILTITGNIVYLEGKEWRVAKKKPPIQARSHSSLYHTTPWLLPHGHEHQRSDCSRRKLTGAAWWGAELPVCWPRVPGEVPTCSSQPRHQGSVGLPAAPCRTGTETAELFSQPGLICLHAHCSELASQTLAVCLMEKQVTVQPNKRPKLHLVNTVSLCQTAAALLQQDNKKPRTKCWL